MKIIREAMAGTLESSDVMVRIAPAEGPQHDLLIASSVEKQFGAAIRHTLLEVLQRYEVEPVQVIVDDKGALDCVRPRRQRGDGQQRLYLPGRCADVRSGRLGDPA